jgi:hypothetical protein
MENSIIKTSGKTKNKKEGRSSEEHITDPSNMRMGETRKTEGGMEASSDGGQG